MYYKSRYYSFVHEIQNEYLVGAGDTAAEEATYLAKLCKKVHLLVRRDEMRASKIMQERVFKTPNLEVSEFPVANISPKVSDAEELCPVAML